MGKQQPRAATDAAFYVRALPDDPGDFMEVQIAAIHRYARANHLEVVKAYFDLATTRSQFAAMMADATGEDPPFRVILVYDLGRLADSAEERREWTARLEANGVKVVAVEPADSGTAD